MDVVTRDLRTSARCGTNYWYKSLIDFVTTTSTSPLLHHVHPRESRYQLGRVFGIAAGINTAVSMDGTNSPTTDSQQQENVDLIAHFIIRRSS